MAGRPKSTEKVKHGSPGRPSALDGKTHDRMKAALLAGNTFEDACVYAGVHRQTGHNWMTRGRQTTKGEYREFFDMVEEARASYKVRLVMKVHAGTTIAGAVGAKFALETLARRHPKEWARTNKLELDDKTPGAGKRAGLRERIISQLDRVDERLKSAKAPNATEIPLPGGEDDD